MTALVIAAALVLVVGTVTAIATRGLPAPMPPVVMIYSVVLSAGLVGVGAYLRYQDQRLYDACVNSVTRSDGNRAQHLAIYDVLDEEGVTEISGRLRAELDINLPERSLDECKEP